GRRREREGALAGAGVGEPLGGSRASPFPSMDFLQHVVNGLLQGFIFALIGLGFSMVWGILNIINLAHAAFIMVAAYLTYFLWASAGVDPFISLPLTMGALFALGFLLQRYVINLVMGASI